VRVRTLGGLELEGAPLTRPKPLLLLAYLALEGPSDKRDLAALFWPRAKRPRRSLDVALAHLRRDAPGSVETAAGRVATSVPSDAAAFLARVDEGAVEAAEAVYAGAFLVGLDLPLGVELEEWLFATREHLAACMRSLLLRAAEADADAGAYADARDRASRAVDLDGAPPATDDQRRLFHALVLAADSPRAATARRELGGAEAEHPATVAQARAWLRRRRPASVPTASTLLPRTPGPLIGRTQELDALQGALDGGDRLVTVLGPPGVGKTRLAIQAARHTAEADGFDDVRFVALAEARTEPQMLSAIADTVRPRATRADADVDDVARWVGDRGVLLVLDNLEQLAGAKAAVSSLLDRCRRLSLLVTSRERLHLAAERPLVLDGLAVPAEGASVEEVEASPAASLFLSRARRVAPDVALDAERAAAVAQICRRMGGLPLGLELAATWLRLLPVADVAHEVASLDRLATPADDVPSRHRSVRAAIGWSWDLLPRREREAFARLSVFRGGFTREAARRVAGAGLVALASLSDKSLVRPEAEGRFSMHPLLAEFARTKLDELPHAAETRRRHAAYVQTLAEEASPHLTGPGAGAWLRRLDAEHDNLRSALAHLRREDPAAALRLAATAWRFWVVRPHNREGREVLTELVDMGGAEAPSPDRAKVLRALGTLTFQAGDFAGAEPILREALACAEARDERHEVAAILNGLAWVATHLGTAGAGGDYGREALRANREVVDARGTALAHNNLAYAAIFRGAFGRALDEVEESLRRFDALGDERGVAHLRTNMAFILATQGRYDEAEELLAATLEVLARLGDEQLRVWALLHRALARIAQGRLDEARLDAEEAWRRVRDVGNRELLGAVLTACADAAGESGRVEEATRLVRTAHATWREAGYPWMWAMTHRTAARLAGRRGATRDAARELVAACELGRRIEDRHGLAETAREAAYLVAERRPERASRLLGVARRLRNECGAVLSPRFLGREAATIRRIQSSLGTDRHRRSVRAGSRSDPAGEIAAALGSPA
jgi:predicted ATPase